MLVFPFLSLSLSLSLSRLTYCDDNVTPLATASNQVLIRVGGSSVNPCDSDTVNGVPGCSINADLVPGGDVAGTVVEAGGGCNRLKVGDRVWGNRFAIGTQQQHQCIPYLRLEIGCVLFSLLGTKHITSHHITNAFGYISMTNKRLATTAFLQGCANPTVHICIYADT